MKPATITTEQAPPVYRVTLPIAPGHDWEISLYSEADAERLVTAWNRERANAALVESLERFCRLAAGRDDLTAAERVALEWGQSALVLARGEAGTP